MSGGGSGAVGSGGSHDERDQDDEGGSEGDYYYYDDRDEEIMRNHNVDDFILGLCLWHQENGPSSSSSSSLSPSPDDFDFASFDFAIWKALAIISKAKDQETGSKVSLCASRTMGDCKRSGCSTKSNP